MFCYPAGVSGSDLLPNQPRHPPILHPRPRVGAILIVTVALWAMQQSAGSG